VAQADSLRHWHSDAHNEFSVLAEGWDANTGEIGYFLELVERSIDHIRLTL